MKSYNLLWKHSLPIIIYYLRGTVMYVNIRSFMSPNLPILWSTYCMSLLSASSAILPSNLYWNVNFWTSLSDHLLSPFSRNTTDRVVDPDLIHLGQWSRIRNLNTHPYPGPKKQIEMKSIVSKSWMFSWDFWSLNSLLCKFQKNYVKYFGPYNIFFICKFFNFGS